MGGGGGFNPLNSVGKAFKGLVGGAGELIGGVGAFFAPPEVPKSPTAPGREDPAVQEARRKALAAEAEARGRRRTLLTGGQGVTAEPLVARARLLGGV